MKLYSFMILVGIILEAIAIGIAWKYDDEESPLGWGLRVAAAFVIWGGYNEKSGKSTPIIIILIVSCSIPTITRLYKRWYKKNEAERIKAEKARAETEAAERNRVADEERIRQHMPIIQGSPKFADFKQFYERNKNRITRLSVGSGSVSITLVTSLPVYVPDYQRGIWVENNSRREYATFFGVQNNERLWTVFEEEALARVIDNYVDRRILRLDYRKNGIRSYIRPAPTEAIVAQRPY